MPAAANTTGRRYALHLRGGPPIDTELLERFRTQPLRVINASLADLDDLLRNHLGDGVVAVHQIESTQRFFIRPIETRDVSGLVAVPLKCRLIGILFPPQNRQSLALSLKAGINEVWRQRRS